MFYPLLGGNKVLYKKCLVTEMIELDSCYCSEILTGLSCKEGEGQSTHVC